MNEPEREQPRGSTIHVLAPEVAQRIAAGEVIDRPAAVVRELMDNSLDAQSQRIDVAIRGGGADLIEVIDDGVGMGKEDLQLCWLPHATSKIHRLEDLERTTTLGFRGEALAAIAAVSRLEITSSPDGERAWQLDIGPLTRPQEEPILRSVQRSQGTTVRVRALFETVPARKKFLKRPPAEAQLCYQVFCDKAMAFPEREFRFLQEGTLKTLLPATKGYKDRFSQILLSEGEKPFLHELYGVGEGFSVHILIGGPELYRSDRRNQFVFANHRRIQEYTLLHALEYGCQGFFPNGTHPVGALFIVIDPALVDFNIHPAKREVRFKDPAVIHHTITRTLQEFFGRHVLYVQTYETTENREPLRENFLLETNFPPQQDNRIPFSPAYSSFPREEHLQSSPYRRSLGEENALAFGIAETTGPLGITEGSEQIQNHPSFFVPFPRKDRDEIVLPGEGFLYLGQLFNLFLIVEKNNALYLIDQHAAHERILYDELQKRPPPAQELLVPLPFTTDMETTDSFLMAHQQELARYGLIITSETPGSWLLEALPSCWKLSPEKTIEQLLDMYREREHFAQRWLATLACHSAIQDGEILDDATARALAEAALALPEPRCPHGRPIWVCISRQDLFKMVRRLE